MKKYGVRFTRDGSMNEDSKTNSLEEAKNTARAYANWNLECEVINLETGAVEQHFAPYSKEGAERMAAMLSR